MSEDRIDPTDIVSRTLGMDESAEDIDREDEPGTREGRAGRELHDALSGRRGSALEELAEHEESTERDTTFEPDQRPKPEPDARSAEPAQAPGKERSGWEEREEESEQRAERREEGIDEGSRLGNATATIVGTPASNDPKDRRRLKL